MALIQQARAKFLVETDRELARKPDEPEPEYAVRSRAQQAVVGMVLALLDQSELLVAGLRIAPDDREAIVELRLDTTADGSLATWFEQISLTAHRFASVRESDSALSCITGMRLTEEGQALGSDIVNFVRLQAEQNPIPELTAPERSRILQALETLQSSIDSRLIEGFAQFRSEPGEPFILLTGLFVVKPEGLQEAMKTVLPYVAKAPNVARVESGVGKSESLSLHQVVSREVRSRDVRFYGADAALYLGTGRDSCWFAVGGNSTPSKLAELEQQAGLVPLPEAAIENQDDIKQDDAPREVLPLVSFTLHLQAWLPLVNAESARHQTIRELVKAAFPAGQTDDALDVELASTGRGVKLRFRFDEGYLRLAARTAARQDGEVVESLGSTSVTA